MPTSTKISILDTFLSHSRVESCQWATGLRIVVRLVGEVEIFLRIAFEDVVPAFENDLSLGPFSESSRQFMVQILNSVESGNLLAESPLLAHSPSDVPARAQLQN